MMQWFGTRQFQSGPIGKKYQRLHNLFHKFRNKINRLNLTNSAPAVPLIEPLIKQAKSLLTPQVKDYLSFKQMITPRLVNFVFWVSAILCLLSGLGLMLLSLFSLKIEGIAIGFFLMLIGPIIIRVYCELLIVFFRMNETLIEISHALAEKK